MEAVYRTLVSEYPASVHSREARLELGQNASWDFILVMAACHTVVVETDDDGATQDIRFADYEPLGGGWIAPLVEAYADGERVFWEEYSDMVADPDLDPVLFDPARWADGVAAGAE